MAKHVDENGVIGKRDRIQNHEGYCQVGVVTKYDTRPQIKSDGFDTEYSRNQNEQIQQREILNCEIFSKNKILFKQWENDSFNRKQLEEQFMSLPLKDEKVSENNFKDMLYTSGLDSLILKQVWNLSDIDKDGYLNYFQFILAKFLILYIKEDNNNTLPEKIPEKLIHTIKRSGDMAEVRRWLDKEKLDSYAVTFEEKMCQIKYDHFDEAYTWDQVKQLQQNEIPKSGIFSKKKIPDKQSVNDFFKQEQLEAQFMSLPLEDEKVSENNFKDTLYASGLHHLILKQIWNLADIDKDGYLNYFQFIIAKFLIAYLKEDNNNTLPDKLPEKLIHTIMRSGDMTKVQHCLDKQKIDSYAATFEEKISDNMACIESVNQSKILNMTRDVEMKLGYVSKSENLMQKLRTQKEQREFNDFCIPKTQSFNKDNVMNINSVNKINAENPSMKRISEEKQRTQKSTNKIMVSSLNGLSFYINKVEHMFSKHKIVEIYAFEDAICSAIAISQNLVISRKCHIVKVLNSKMEIDNEKTSRIVIILSHYSEFKFPMFQFYRFAPAKLRDDANLVQLSQIQFFGIEGSQLGVKNVCNPKGKIIDDNYPMNVINGNASSKWCDLNKGNLIFDFGAPVCVVAYKWATANDCIERDPVRWKLEGSINLNFWKIVDDRTNVDQVIPKQRQVYTNKFHIGLQHSNLQDLKIEDMDMNSITPLISNNPKRILPYLRRNFNIAWWITSRDIDALIPILLSLIPKMPIDLIYILIKYCRTAPNLEKLFTRIGTQRVVTFYDENLRDCEADAFGLFFTINTTLEAIDLAQNKITALGMHRIGEGLKNNTTLATLRVAANSLGDLGARAVGNMLKGNSRLVQLDFGRNKIGDVGLQYIANGLKINTTLEELNLSTNNISDSGAQALADALTVNSTLLMLSLDENSIGDIGTQAISSSLEMNSTIIMLALSSNFISSHGAQAIAKVLKINTTLKDLYLIKNNIATLGAQVIAEALEVNNTLHDLYMSNNNVGNIGAEAFGDCLKVNSSLQELDLAFNQIEDAGAEIIAEGLSKNKTLKKIYLLSNNINERGEMLIRQAIRKHPSIIKCQITIDDIL